MTSGSQDARADEILVRSTWHAAKVPGHDSPYDVAHLKVYYPATEDATEDAKQSGEMAADLAAGPLPVVVFASGVNCSQDAYRWLAIELVKAGFVAVTYDYVGELVPGHVGISPGLDFSALSPDVYGTKPTCDVFQPVLDTLARLNTTAAFADLFDLNRVAFGGHSAGGTVALQSARRDLFPGLRAVFSYAGHTVASSMLRVYEPGTVLEAAPDVASLLMSGEEDGVFKASAGKYGAHGADPVTVTFEQGVPAARVPEATSWLARFKGANHFAIGTHEDPTGARGFLDGVATVPPEETRETLVGLVTEFLRSALNRDEVARARLEDLEASPPPTISLIRHR